MMIYMKTYLQISSGKDKLSPGSQTPKYAMSNNHDSKITILGSFNFTYTFMNITIHTRTRAIRVASFYRFRSYFVHKLDGSVVPKEKKKV